MFRNRKEIVKFNNSLSSEIDVNSDTFQGSVLSPIFFALYTSDIENGINSILKQFADDNTLIKLVYNDNDCDILQNDINNILLWSKDNGFELNPEKSKHMRITLKNCDQLPMYTIDKAVIKTVNEHKHFVLCFILDSKLKFNLFCDELVSKAFKKWYAIKRICSKADGKTLLRLYKEYVIPIVEFCSLDSKQYTIPQNRKGSEMDN